MTTVETSLIPFPKNHATIASLRNQYKINRKVNYQEKIDLTLEELKTLLSQQKSLINRQKIQTLYWLKTGYSQSVTDVALRLGVHRTKVHRWLKQYSEEGLKKFLEIRLRPGRPRVIPPEVIRGIEHKLNQETTGFKSYKEIEKWVEENYQISRKYQTLHHQVRYRLQAKLKTPRRSSIKKNPLEETELKKKLKNILKVCSWLESTTKNPAKNGIKYWCQDETRLGLKTRESKVITALGVKPKGFVQWNFKSYYIYGAIAPKSGESFFLEFSHLDGDCFQIFLDHFSQSYPSYLNIIQLDNGRFHVGSKLKIPDNILLIFQPPYSPEFNPIERVWHYLKQHLRWEIYQDIEQLKDQVRSVIEGFSPEIIASLTGWDYILDALATVA